MDVSSARYALAADGCRLETLATAAPGRWQRRWAAIGCAAGVAATVAVLPWAKAAIWPMPGFVPAYQACLIGVYALTTYLFFVQHRRARSLPLLILGAGSLYTTSIVTVQLLTFPGVFAAGRILGAGPDTTTWLWTFWHLGPPAMAIAYAIAESHRLRFGFDPAPDPSSADASSIWVSPGMLAGAAVLAAAMCSVLAISFVGWLPRQVVGDDYGLVTSSGVGPAIIVLTLIALAWLCAATRLRTVLQLWLAVSLVLLVADNWLTLAGQSRGTVGWIGGRLEALLAGVVVLVVYLREIDLLYRRAELTAIERERARVEVERVRDNLTIALDAAGMGDWEFDIAAGRTPRTDRQDRIFGYRDGPRFWDRETFLAQILPEDRGLVEREMKRADISGQVEIECRIRRADDGAVRWIAIRGRTSYDADGTPLSMAGVVMDTTERHAAADRAQQVQRMEAIGQLTGGVAHDYNNLLTVITGNLELILRRSDDPVQVERLAASAMEAARHGADVTDKLLSFSRRQLFRPETVNVNRLLTDLRPTLERECGGSLSIALDLDPTVEPTTLDPRQFESAIRNLVLNARDAMARAGAFGPVRIGTGTVASGAGVTGESGAGATGAVVRRAVSPPEEPGTAEDFSGYVRVIVTDCGGGMDAAIAARAFEPFFTTKEMSSGAGLGLSQVYGFAKQAQGHVRLESAPGRGTTVELLLPRARQQAPSAQMEGGPAPGAAAGRDRVPLRRATGGEVVLVVEDEPTVREMAVESLRDLGYRTFEACDAAAALALLRTGERIDVMFSDVVMPGGMNGVQLAVEARRLRPALKVLLTSGYTALTDDRGVPPDVQLLPKPYRRAQLASQLSVVMAG